MYINENSHILLEQNKKQKKPLAQPLWKNNLALPTKLEQY